MIVGIGASAGGIDALKAFFSHVPIDSGLAYVVILHLSPDHESALAEVLQTSAAIPIAQVRERVRVEPDRVYVIPPNRGLAMEDGHLVTSGITGQEERRAPIDIFFRTLAHSHRERAVCVVLSGTGADGSMGLKHIKECGGLCLAQSPTEAAYGDMPRHAIATGLIDDVLPAAELPARIAAYRQSRFVVELPQQDPSQAEEHALREIFTLLRVRTGHDFSNYKRTTLLRRLGRRMIVNGQKDLAAYAEYFSEHADEAQALLKDLLISVTNFFRDAGAFAELERSIIPRLFQNKGENDEVRVWVAGCATGEEAYSIAMLLCENMPSPVNAPRVQIFATDIDEWALAKARAGFYTLNDAADVSSKRLARFFVKDAEGYRVCRELREMVLFAAHNAIRQPPFSRLDLVTCRNLLIYMNRPSQQSLVEVFHFALRPGGYLLLGTSESVDGASSLFAVAYKDAHIFQSRAVEPRRAPPGLSFSAWQIPALAAGPPIERARERLAHHELHQRLLEQYAPPSVVVNEEHEVVHLSERAGRYLHIKGGAPSSDLLKLVRPELRLDLRAALSRAVRSRTNVTVPAIPLEIDGETERVDLVVRPVLRHSDSTRGFILVLFEPVISAPTSPAVVMEARGPDDALTRQLEEDLAAASVRQRATSEQYELQQEELKASNEELQAINEELRSASEELETGKEELQSLNEELTTVNQELKVKIDELTQANDDIRNLMNSTEIATIFVDRQKLVKLMTPRVRDIFNLEPRDTGRPLADITHRLRYREMLGDVDGVLDTLHTVEREVDSEDDRWYLARLMPYRTYEDHIGGVVLTFVDITARMHADIAVRASEEQFRRAIEEAPIPVIMHAEDGEVLQISRAWTELTGYTLHDVPTVERWLTRAYGPGANLVRSHMQALFANGQRTLDVEFTLRTRSDEERNWSFSASSPGTLRDGRRFIVGMAVDITERTRAESAMRESEERYRMLFDSIDEGFCIIEMIHDEAGLAQDYRFVEVNAAFARQTGIADAVGKRMRELVPSHEEEWFQIYSEVAATGEPVRFESRADGLSRWFDVYAARVGGAGSDKVAVVFSDITERRSAQEALRRSEERLRLTLESVLDYAIFTTDMTGRIETWNVGAENIFGYRGAEAIGQNAQIVFTPEDRERGAHLEEMNTAREEGRALDERWHLRKDGSRFYASGVLAPLRDGARLIGYTKIAQDLTRRRQTEEALREAREQLEARVEDRTRELAQTNEALRDEMRERKQAEESRIRLLGQLVEAQESECRRISRELHDQLGQQVTALGLKIASLKEAPTLPAPLKRELENLEEISKQLDHDVDFLVWELRPLVLDDLGLVEALSNYVVAWARHFEVPARLTATGMEKERLPGEFETVLYRITQEALNNVAKHAGAREVDVILERRSAQVSLIVEDNGSGFDPQFKSGAAAGFGLAGMRERAALAGGTMNVESAPGGGTTVFVRLPLPTPGARDD